MSLEFRNKMKEKQRNHYRTKFDIIYSICHEKVSNLNDETRDIKDVNENLNKLLTLYRNSKYSTKDDEKKMCDLYIAFFDKLKVFNDNFNAKNNS